MQHIKRLLEKRIQESGLSENVKTALACEAFEVIIAERYDNNILKKVKPLYIKNKILNITCVNSVIMQEINMIKQELIDKVNKKVNQEIINDIKFSL